MDNLDQSIIVDEEFCDKNLFSLYQNSIRQNAKLNPKINLQDYQLNTINRYHNIVYLDQSNIKSKLKTLQSIGFHQRSKTCRCQSIRNSKNLKSLSTDIPQNQIQKPQICFFRGIRAQQNLIQSGKKKNQFIITNTQELPVVEICSNKNAEQKPASFRYNDLQLNQYLEEFKLLKQETLTSVILPHVSLKTNRTQFNQTQATNRYQTNNNYYNNIIPKNKVQQRQTNLESQNQTLTLSGWSDYSNQ